MHEIKELAHIELSESNAVYFILYRDLYTQPWIQTDPVEGSLINSRLVLSRITQ
jgi:hypothetical protein